MSRAVPRQLCRAFQAVRGMGIFELMRDVIKGPGIAVELDTREIYPNDPGMGTPVIVNLDNGETATWNVAVNEGETVDGTKFTDEQKEWLKTVEQDVEEWMEENGV